MRPSCTKALAKAAWLSYSLFPFQNDPSKLTVLLVKLLAMLFAVALS